MDTPTIALLLTGNELMSGDTVDSNSAMIATRLGEYGLEVGEKCTVGDDPALLQSALTRLTTEYPAVIVNGGLGPTRDDLTSEVVASLNGVELIENPDARAHVEDWCARRRIAPNPANLKQAFVPEGCELIHNPLGSALGFAIEIKGCLVLTTPGVPSELEAMLPALITHLRARIGGEARQILRLQTFGIGESSVEERIKNYADRWPNDVTLGFRAGMPQLELKLSVPSAAQLPAQEAALALLEEDFGDHILGTGSTRLAEKLQSVLRDQSKTMTSAEIGVAVSGIAGPGGGTEDKPVGTVWIAWGTQEDLRTHTTVVSGSRGLFQNIIAAACLDLMRRHLLRLPPLPHYFIRQA